MFLASWVRSLNLVGSSWITSTCYDRWIMLCMMRIQLRGKM
ncbi:hypothetical protein HanPSC8_Chr17g0783721 [Helianthus annuus]|nr:hypothetical protein HanPSC8_Chr17g0783721 [Helianthus annuus]